MTQRRALFLSLLALGLLAGGLRFFRLGDWPFHGDEVATLWETASFSQTIDQPPTDATDRLPRMLPVAYALHYFDYRLFGSDEFGSRVLPALFGTLQVLLVFLMLDRSLGRVPALATALLVALWPEHVCRSQENRFYMTASLFSWLCVFSGALAVQRRSLLWAVLACAAALAALLSHTLQGLLLVGLFAGILAAGWTTRDRRLVAPLGVITLTGLIAAGLLVGYLIPLGRGWNSGGTWGYGAGHALLASVSQLGWPVALLAMLGAVSGWRNGGELDRYWLTWAGLWFVASLLLPRFVVYHPGYVFPLTAGVLVLAGRAVAQVYEGLRASQFVTAGWVWVALACILNLPSLVSHYSDGSRHDFRTPAQHISANWQPGDRVASFMPGLLSHYLKPGIEPIHVRASDSLATLKQLTRKPGRVWIVVPSARGGKPEALARWLGRECSQQLHVCRKRFDYYEHVTEVYLYDAPGDEPAWMARN